MNNDNNQNSKVVDAEIVGPESPGSGRQNTGGSAWSGYGPRVTRVWTAPYAADSGCLPAFVTLFLFLACLGQYGLLAAIGFFFFHVVGSIIGTFRASARLVAGIPYNPWPWRCGNWIVSFLLTVWLAGGFAQ